MEKVGHEAGELGEHLPVVHSQVRKIKQEDEKIKGQETYQQPQVSEMRLVFRDLARQLSRSPLGQVGREISVADS